MSDAVPIIHIVDDDADARESLVFLLRTVGLTVRAYGSADEFLKSADFSGPGCLVSDVRMPGISGLELFERLTALGSLLPVIFITAHADVPMAVRALKAGAAEFVEKPFHAQTMIDRIHQALLENERRRTHALEWSEVHDRLSSLTDKERETLTLIGQGAPNKAIASRLQISERAVEMRRATLMKKLKAHSVAELIRMVTRHELSSETHADPQRRANVN